MRCILLCSAILLCCCHNAHHQNLSSQPRFDPPPGTIELKMKKVNGIYYPDYMSEDDVLKYAEKFKKDEGDSAHYRLGAIGNWNCVSANGVTCDTLRLYVVKLVPFKDVNKIMTDLGADAWRIEQQAEYCKIEGGKIFFNGATERAATYFGRVNVERSLSGKR